MHLDGARIWHVAAETGISLKELCEPFDSISMCFSKGLGMPFFPISRDSVQWVSSIFRSTDWDVPCWFKDVHYEGTMAAQVIRRRDASDGIPYKCCGVRPLA